MIELLAVTAVVIVVGIVLLIFTIDFFGWLRQRRNRPRKMLQKSPVETSDLEKQAKLRGNR